MKKIFAILLFTLLLFNWYGVQPLIHWLEQRADEQMTVSLDKKAYDESSLIEISVPNRLPYSNESISFQRIDGSIEINGQHYNYVERKIADGKIIYRCIVNDYKNKLSNSKDDFLKFAYDAANAASSKKSDNGKSVSAKKTIDDCIDHRIHAAQNINCFNYRTNTTTDSYLANGFTLLLYQPPKAALFIFQLC